MKFSLYKKQVLQSVYTHEKKLDYTQLVTLQTIRYRLPLQWFQNFDILL